MMAHYDGAPDFVFKPQQLAPSKEAMASNSIANTVRRPRTMTQGGNLRGPPTREAPGAHQQATLPPPMPVGALPVGAAPTPASPPTMPQSMMPTFTSEPPPQTDGMALRPELPRHDAFR